MPKKAAKGSKKGKVEKGDKLYEIEPISPEIHKILTAKDLLTSNEDVVVLQVNDTLLYFTVIYS